MQIFRNVPASKFAHPPDRSYRCEYPPQGSRGFYIRAHRALLPPHAPDMLTVRIQAIDGTGTFTLPDFQPCRLLTLLRGRYSASQLLRTHPPPSRRRSISRLSRLYDLPCSGDFAPGRGGLLQLLGMSLSPCCRFHPAEVQVPHRSDFGTPCSLRPSDAGSALGSIHYRGHIRVHCRYGPVTRDLPKGDLVDRLQDLGFPSPCYPSYGAPDSCPGRSTSC